MALVRRIGLLIVAIAAVAVWFVMAPDDLPIERAGVNLSSRDYERLVDQALSDFDLNEALADSAPQQQVVAGWVARDLLSIIALAQADQVEASTGLVELNETLVHAVAVRDDRIPALLGLAVLAVCLHGVTLPVKPSSRNVGAEGASHQGEPAASNDLF